MDSPQKCQSTHGLCPGTADPQAGVLPLPNSSQTFWPKSAFFKHAHLQSHGRLSWSNLQALLTGSRTRFWFQKGAEHPVTVNWLLILCWTCSSRDRRHQGHSLTRQSSWVILNPLRKAKEVKFTHSKVRDQDFSMPIDLLMFYSLTMSSFNKLMFTKG